jgi:ribosomal protein L11 methylase PrmA
MTMHRRMFLPLLSSAVFGQYEESKGDVPWVPTPDEVMDTMFRMAKVKARDIVYDLGSGDGRVLVYAAKKFGARGVGVEIEGHRVKEAREAARSAGVSDRVRFVEEDLFKADIGEATVVFIYLFTAVMTRVRPKLFSELKPGTRVVAYQFNGFTDWKLARVDNSHPYPAYLWVVPKRAA